MDCQQVEREETIEAYLTNRLSPEAQQEFEEHFFQCSQCFDQVQTVRATQAELAASQKTIRAEAPAQPAKLRWGWAAALAAAAVILMVVWVRLPTPESQTPQAVVAPPVKRAPPMPGTLSLAEMARVDPPAYTPTVLRGPADEAARKFRDAMQHYTRGDCQAAIPGLRASAKLNPKAADASFFLAICYLLMDQTDSAIASLQKTIALGDTAYLEEAHFYLAKAFLGKGDLDSAQAEFQETVRLQGEHENKARELLQQVEALRGRNR